MTGETGESPSFSALRRFGFVGGPLAFAAILLLPAPEGMTPEAQRVAAAAVLMAIWWMTEAIPIPATALVPLALFPLLGVLDAPKTAAAYGDQNIFLFAGGFFIAMAMQKWNLHERIAVAIIARAGGGGRRLVLGFMIATAFLSLWISNTATAMMMVPIAIAVIGSIETNDPGRNAALGTALFLGIAYAASIGGIGTLIGTPPNAVFIAQLKALYPDSPPVTFAAWLWLGLPFVIVMLPVAWLILTRVAFRVPGAAANDALEAIIAVRRSALGPMSRGEAIVAAVSLGAALCWIFRPLIAKAFPEPAFIQDSTIAIFFALLLFLIPVNLREGRFALDWEWARRIPWGILLLFGGGIALAQGFVASGLVAWTGERLTLLAGVPPIVMVFAIALLITFLTEMTSNTATTQIFLPILAVTASEVLQVHPFLLMVPATISASCAFMLPVATPPNAVVFASGHVTVPQMARAGLLLNFAGAAVVVLVVYLLMPWAFAMGGFELPDWAANMAGN